MKGSTKSDGGYRSLSHHRLRDKYRDPPAQRSVSLEANPRKMRTLLSQLPLSFKNAFKSKKTNRNISKEQASLNTNITVASAATEEDSVIGKSCSTGRSAKSCESHSKSHSEGVDDSHDGLMRLIQEKHYQNNIINQEKNAMKLYDYQQHHPHEINMIKQVKSHDTTDTEKKSLADFDMLSQDKQKLQTENTELIRQNELLNIKQANLELILKEKDKNEQELPKLRKKYKKY